MRFDDSKIEEIKSRVDIVELASEYLTLKKAGRNYLGLCPFHQEKTPSFTVNREKQIFYCFGCGEGGNAISFLMKISNKSFPEAIRHLAEKTGVILPAKTMNRQERERETLREELLKLNLSAAQFYARNLVSAAGRGSREYLAKRSVSEETVRAFRLGFAPDSWRALADNLDGAGLSLKSAEQAGLVIAGKEGGYYDRFRGRLIFPIEDVSGDIVAFGGRIMDQGEPKYLNSPESPVYVKGRNLFGLNKAREAIRQTGLCLIVEGYFDVISLWNAGVQNVVATLGTALTRDHLELLRRYTQDVIAVFDPDEAGKKALERSLELFLAANIRARALILPDGLDPDDYIKTRGREDFDQLLATAPSISDYYIDHILGDGTTFEENRDLVKTAMVFVSKIGNEIEKNLFLKRISEKLGIDQALLKRELQRRKDGDPKRDIAKSVKPADQAAPNPLEISLIRLLLEYPQQTVQMETEGITDYFLDMRLKDLCGQMIRTYKLLGYLDINVILTSDDDKGLREYIYKLSIEAPPTDYNMVERTFSDNVRRIKQRWYKEQKRRIQLLLKQAQESGDTGRLVELTMEKQRLMREEKAIR